MRVLVVSCSPVYNLGAARVATYYRMRGDDVFLWQGGTGYAGESRAWRTRERPAGESALLSLWEEKPDRLYLSAIFTWDLPELVRWANLAQAFGVDVQIGGPAPTAMHEWVNQQTGIPPHLGLDPRFENLPGKYQATFTSRGCPRRCRPCLVPKLEGNHMVEYPDFPLAAFISDNNILATGFQHQVRVVDRLKRLPQVDFNSGFDVRLFTPEHFDLYRRLDLKFWRFAFDTLSVERELERCIGILQRGGVANYRIIIVYILAGFGKDTPDRVRYRAERVRQLGASPYVMAYRPLDTLSRRHVPAGWSREDMDKLVAYYNFANIWRSVTYEEFSRAHKATAQASLFSSFSRPQKLPYRPRLRLLPVSGTLFDNQPRPESAWLWLPFP